MSRDYTELRKRIKWKFDTIKAFADAMGIGYPTISKKLAGASDWKRAEIEKAAQLLSLSAEEVHHNFF